MIHPPNVIDGLHKRTSGFDFLIGDWTVANRRLSAPLSGEDDWYDTEATASATNLHNGAISVDEMWYAELGFAGSSIRVHSPRMTRGPSTGSTATPGTSKPRYTEARSEDGSRFVATGPDEFDGTPILARYYWHSIAPDSATWEQAFSVAGETWETNWVMEWTGVQRLQHAIDV